MKRERHAREQAVRELCEGERLLSAGEELGSVLRLLEIAESAWNRWRGICGGMKAADVKELKGLRVENARLKKLLAEAEPGQGDAEGSRGGRMAAPQRPNHAWALVFQFDETAARRCLKLLNVIDEHTREALAIRVDHSLDADGAVEAVERIAAQRGAPAHLRMDNGPQPAACAVGHQAEQPTITTD